MVRLPWFVGCTSLRSSSRRPFGSGWVALLFGCAAGSFLLLGFGSEAAAQSSSQVLRNHVRPEVSQHAAAFVGPMSANDRMDVSIVLPLRNQTELNALLSRLYDPSSPDYRHFLSVAEFTQRFGPTEDDYQAVVSFANSHGLHVKATPANRLVVPVSGSVEQISNAFHVQMNVYQHPTENRTFFSPDREPSLDLGVPISHISGLDSFSLPQPMLVQAEGAQPMATVTGSGPGGSYLASDMRAAYYGGTTLTGSGQAVALLEFSGYSISDVDKTFSTAGQTYTVPINNVLLDGASGTGSGNGEAEVVLDIVQAIGMAPALSQVRVYIGQGVDDANILNSMASENIAKQISCSWSWRPYDPSTTDPFFQEFAAQGQSFFTASGDSGAFYSPVSPFFFPQEDAYVISVGGTHLTTSGAGGAWSSETAWHSGSGGSGGGISPDNIPIPSWQSGVANAANGGSTTLRNVPDVAMEGDFDNYVCSNGSCAGSWAGTSFAAPRWAGFMALVNQQAVEAGTAPTGGIGFINPTLYQIGGGANYSSNFHDVTSGNNDTANQPTWYSAVSGYDLVTGWGSASGQALIDTLAGPQVPGFWIQASSSNVAVSLGTSSSTTITVTDAGGFNDPVNLAVTSSLPSGVTAAWSQNPTSGSSVLTLTASDSAPASTTNLTITGTSGSLTATTNITVSVHAPTFTLSASPSSVSVNQGASATSTITVAPLYGFTGSVNLSIAGLPSGVTASFGTNPTSASSVLTFIASNSVTAGTYVLTLTGTSGNLTITSTITLNIHAPSFTLTGPGTVNIGQGSSGTAYVYVISQYGFTGNVNLSVTGLPIGVTASFSPNPATGSSTLTLTAANSASIGTSTVTITGTSGNLTASTSMTLGVFAPTFTISNFGTVTVGQGSSSSTYIYVYGQYGFNGSVTFNVSGLPPGVTALWSPNPTTGSTMLTLSASSSAVAGQYPLTITGASGSITATSSYTLAVKTPTFTLSGSGANVGQGNSGTGYVYVYPQYGFTGAVNLAVTGLPSGVTASFSPNPTTGNSTLSFHVGNSVPAGQYPLTVTGTSGTQTASLTLTLGVYVPTFSLSSSNVTIGQGTSASSYVSVFAQYGFTGSVNLSISGLPSGVTAVFSPNPTTGGSTITFTATSTATLGQYPVTITGTSGTQTATANITVSVYTPTFTVYTYSSPSIGQGTSTTAYVYETPQYGFTGSVTLSVSGLPSGVTASFAPNPTTGSSTLTLAASSTAALGQYTVTITGTSGSQVASTTMSLGIYTPTFTISSYTSPYIGQGSSGTAYVYVNPQYGFAGGVSFSVSGLPSGVTASFSPNPTTGSTVLTLQASSSAALGQYALTITGTSGSISAATTMTLTINAQGFTMYGSPSVLTMNQGTSTTSTLFITPQYGFTGGVTFSASGLPSGVTASFSPNPGTTSSLLTLTASGTATPGPATITVTGTSGALSVTTTINLTVNASAFTLLDSPGVVSLLPGQSETSGISVVPQNGFSGSVALAITGLPSGVTASFSPGTTASGSTLTLNVSASATPGSTIATITGTSGSLTSSVPLTINVKAASATTSTSLAVTAAGSPVTTVTANTAVAMTAGVTAGPTKLTSGRVLFCDGAPCDALHAIGTAQLTSTGLATLKFTPGPGTHNLKALFLGVNSQASSSSDPSVLTVTGAQPSTTTISQSGAVGQYTLSATVTGQGAFAPTGTVSFLDTTNANAVLSTATLNPGQKTLAAGTVQATPVGSQPAAMAAGDFNGDGIQDLAVANSGSNSLTILLGNGDGTFNTSAPTLPTGSQPGGIIAADFNADGKLDLAVANAGNNSITILLGNGDGTFTPSQLSPQTGSYPKTMVVGDFNGDGRPDLAVANQSSNSLTILLGTGDGSFTVLTSTLQAPAQSLAIGDFNGDGVQDLAVVSSSAGTLSILLGNGDGTFSRLSSAAVGSYPQAVAVGDFNGDGFQDLVVANYYSATSTILLGKGDGTFTTSTSSPATGTYAGSVVVADLNGDGIEDLTVPNYYGGTITTLFGKGDGTFTTGLTLTQSYPQALVSADFNGDGVQDLAVTSGSGNTISLVPMKLTQTAIASATAISPVGAGSHAVDASYAGDTSYRPSVSTTTQLTAQPGVPTVTVAPSATSIDTVQALTVTVALSGGTGNPVPTGAVTLASGSYTSGSTTLNGGSASILVPAGVLSPGTDNLTASFVPDASGSSNYRSASGSTSITVTTTTPTVTVTPSASSVSTTQSLTVTVNVNGGSGSPVSTGSVTLTAGAYSSVAVSLSNGSASIVIPAGSLTIGTSVITVSYKPDTAASSIYSNATGSASVTVGKGAPAITLSPSVAAISVTQSLTVTASVSAGIATPTGTVTLSSRSFNTQQTLTAGSAVFNVAAGALPVGTNTLTATYTPDASSASQYSTATQTATVTVSLALGTGSVSLTVTPSALTITDLQTDSVMISVSGSGGQPTGAVSLSSGAYNAQSSLSGGAASLTIPAGSLTAGSNTITVAYSGDPNYAAKTTTTTITVSPVVAAAASPAPISAGSSATATINLTAGTYAGTLNLSCTLSSSPAGAQSLPTCAVNPATVKLSSGGSGTASITLNTTAASNASLMPGRNFKRRDMAYGGPTLALIVMLGLPFRKRRLGRMLILLTIVAAAGVTGCGGSSSSGSSGHTGTPATTAGSYTFTVSAADSSNPTITASAKVTLTVQ